MNEDKWDKIFRITTRFFDLIVTFMLAFGNCICALQQIRQFESCNIAILSFNIIVCLITTLNFAHKVIT